MSDQTPFEKLGGATQVRAICQKFYQVMQTLPEAQNILEMHPKNLQSSEEKLYLFLSGWLGGPRLYEEKYGHPRLRARHLPFSIGKEERNMWILCMVHAFDELKIPEPIRSEVLHPLLNLANHMRNREEDESE